MEAWVGPAIVAALVSGIVSAAGWFVTAWQASRLERQRRTERVRDVQTALQAEIRSHRHALEAFENAGTTEEILHSIAASDAYTPLVTREVEAFVFEAVVGDIHILPGKVIDPIVVYYRQSRALGLLAEDMRDDRFRSLAGARKSEMYRDYVALGVYAAELADEALAALARSLERGNDD